jgi:hypothetical protein
MGFAIQALGPAIGNARTGQVQRTPQPVLHETLAALPIGAGDPAVEVGGSEPFVAIAWARSRFSCYRYQLVDALVTFAVMAWFTAALAWMVGDLHGGTSGPVTETAVIKPSPPAVPQFSASPANTVGAESTSI